MARQKHMGVFYAHPSGMALGQIKKDCRALEELLRERFYKKLGVANSPAIYAMSGRQEHSSGFTGDWEKWQRRVVKRKHATTGDICYHMFVVPGGECGRATAAILSMALDDGRQVVVWDKETGKLQKVKRIQVTDADDWTSGFRATTE